MMFKLFKYSYKPEIYIGMDAEIPDHYQYDLFVVFDKYKGLYVLKTLPFHGDHSNVIGVDEV